MVSQQMNFPLIGSSGDDLMRKMKQRFKPLLAGDAEGKNKNAPLPATSKEFLRSAKKPSSFGT